MSDSEPWNWSDDESDNKPTQSDQVTDLSFRLQCQCLHVDHTHSLHQAVTHALPWFTDEALAGLHLIHVAGSQNGWMRPEEPDDLLHLSRRTRLTIRIPIHRLEDACSLTGKTLEVSGFSMIIGEAAVKPVVPSDILFSRHVITHDQGDENEFLRQSAQELRKMRINFKKLLPGRQVDLKGPHETVRTRSLMVADIDARDSLILQEQGLGDGRHFGCGLFIHHKGIKAVKPDD